MRGGRIASAGLALTGLVLGLGVVASWLAAEPRVVEAAPTSRALPAAEAPESVSRPLPDADAAAASARLEAEAEIAAPIPVTEEPRACQDLDAILKELCELLEQPDGAFPFEVEPRLAAWGADFDQHCVSILEGRLGSPRPSVERLATLCLLRLAPPATQRAELPETERVLLWRLFDTEQPDEVLSATALPSAEEVRQHRENVARLAGKCLAALGGEQDCMRLIEALDGNGAQEMLARYAFDGASSISASNAILERLADPTRRIGQAGNVLDALLNQPGVELDSELSQRAAQGLVGRWRANEVEDHELERVSRILGRLDPSLLAERWGELQDRDAIGPYSRLAAAAWAESSSPADLSRLDGWLGSEEATERLTAARAVLFHASDGVPAADLRRKAAVALDELARDSPDPSVRREALFSAKAAPEVLPAAVSRALSDEDSTVREAAVLAARHLVAKDPSLRARFESAAASDTDARVRRAAAHALR